MASLLTPEELGALARFDSATVSNAIEKFNVRDHTAGTLRWSCAV
jgi:hypothetical protein